jgi:hypothetical protein
MKQPNFEYNILRVEASYRIRLPAPLLRRAGWLAGDQPLDGWLLVGSPGRCRLLSVSEVENDANFQALLARISAELGTASTNSLAFHDEPSVALALRLLPIQITPPEPGWRLTLPRPIAAVMQITPGKSDIAALVFQGHIELWTIETLTFAMSTPLSEFI